MLYPSLLAFVLSASSAVHFAAALRLQTTIKSHPRAQSLRRRALTSHSNLTDPIFNEGQNEYSTNITVGGVPFTVVIDTGSSDLWVLVNGTAPQSKDLGGAPVSIAYGTGTVAGNLHTATVEIGGASIKDQIVLEVAPENSTTDAAGILGVGPPIGSRIFLTQNGSDAARPPLQRLFASDPTGPSFMTTAVLSRPIDPNEPFTGVFTINEIEHGFEVILNEPKLPVSPGVALGTTAWTVEIEESAFSINGVQVDLGKPAPLSAAAISAGLGPGLPYLSAVLDTGTTLANIPEAAARQLYGSVPGAYLDTTLNAFFLPCSTELNITITLGQQSFPIHPLDAVRSFPGRNDCVGGFTPVPANVNGSVGEPDLILGDTFLRSVMMLNSWGGFVNQTVPMDPKELRKPAPAFADTDAPFIQLLSLTDPSKAHLEFVAARGSGASVDNGTTTSSSGTMSAYVPSATTGPTSATPVAPSACASSSGFAPAEVMQRCQSLCSNLMMLAPAVNSGVAM